MTDRPILFSAPMVNALLAGRKTQTRRLIKPQPPADTTLALRRHDCRDRAPAEWGWMSGHLDDLTQLKGLGLYRPRFAEGDRLWIKEAWRTTIPYDDLSPSQLGGDEPIHYEADGALQSWGYAMPVRFGRPRAAMHMVRWASRLTLVASDVRIERLADISEADAIAEGCFKGKASGRVFETEAAMHFGGAEWATARDWYADLWETINGAGTWDANPWVVAITFTVHHGNIDEVKP